MRVSQLASSGTERFTAPATSDLVHSLGVESSSWNRLDASGFELLCLVCINTEPCVAQSEGLWKLYVSY